MSEHALSPAQFRRYRFPEGSGNEHLNDVQYYHGSAHDYEPGHVIDPRQPHEKAGPESSQNTVYFTSDPVRASFYAKRAAEKFGGEPKVYTVDPLGPHNQDFMTRRSPENRSSSHPVLVTGRQEYSDYRAAGYTRR